VGKVIRLDAERTKRAPIVLSAEPGEVVIDLAEGYEGLPAPYELRFTADQAKALASQLHAYAREAEKLLLARRK
jgi:hypothetical protein